MLKWILRLFTTRKRPKEKRIEDFENSAYCSAVFNIWFGEN